MIYQRTMKGRVSRVSGIPFATLAHMPYPQWRELRDHWYSRTMEA